MYKQCINSWNIPEAHIDNIFENCRDGIILSRVVHSIDSEVIDWKKIKLIPKSDFEKNINNNVMIEGC